MSGTVGIRRDILKWLMTLNLSYPLKNAKRDFSNGFLVAEILSRYFPKDIEMHSYDTGTSLAKKKDNWALIEKFLKKKKMGVAFSGKEIEDVVNCEGDHPGVALLEKMYKVLGKARIGGDVCEAPDPVVPTPEFVPASKQAVPRPGGILMRPQQEGAPAGIHFSAQPSLQTPAPSQAPPSRHPHHHQDIDNSYDGGYYQTQSQPNCDAPHGHPGRGYSSQGHPGGGYSSQGHPGGCFNSQGHLGGPPLHLLGPRPGTPPEERERNRQQSMAEGARVQRPRKGRVQRSTAERRCADFMELARDGRRSRRRYSPVSLDASTATLTPVFDSDGGGYPVGGGSRDMRPNGGHNLPPRTKEGQAGGGEGGADLAFRKGPRVMNDYQPYTVEDYKKRHDSGGEYWELGKLKPDLKDEELTEKKAKLDLIKEMDRKNRAANVQALKEQQARPKKEAPKKLSTREKALEFARKVPKPAVAKREEEAPVAGAGSGQEEEREMSVLEQLELQHRLDQERVQAIKQQMSNARIDH
eukprot:CAMPEP_0196598504 /NCGR_PEP_ID=MMETSP1081-20130531/94358_1 /TAXON_ID=36882 /ORGANISM="Pyramimonas amylifera, Strain CCMP720" /LENGTH=523 /DNA_ID=CAMNT_0041924209 /DNA_START=25 /DNA_END=1596 /DNA_ORIENTATION=+